MTTTLLLALVLAGPPPGSPTPVTVAPTTPAPLTTPAPPTGPADAAPPPVDLAPVAVDAPPATAPPATAPPVTAPTDNADPQAPAPAPSPEPATPPAAGDPPEAVGSDEPPLPPAPPRTTAKIRRGGYTGVGWFAVRFALEGGLLPAQRRTLAAGIGFEAGWRPHPVVGVLTRFASWGSTVDTRLVQDDAGAPVTVRDAGVLNGWDVLGMRAFVPLRGRLEPSADLSSGFAVERRPFDPRRTWATVRVGAGLGVWVARTVTLRLEASWRLLARRNEFRHYVGGTLGVSIHF